VVALILIILTLNPPYLVIVADTANDSVIGAWLLHDVNILVGIYVLVRGMDNIDEDLPRRWRKTWDRFFPKQLSN
jgi:hypothetical protein